jgi:carboxyl-terminal processing protease
MHLTKRSHQHALVALMLSAAACGGTEAPPTGPPTEISTAARAYLNEVLRVMQNNSVRRTTIDWTAFYAAVFAAAGPAQSVTETFPGITKALSLLGDGHSSYTAAGGTSLFVSTHTCRASGALPPVSVPPTIGYVKVGAFSGTAAEAAAFANGIQNAIRLADRDDLVGWIVDLRGNSGGNMWPMVAGLGPVLGEGVLGWFIGPTGSEAPWEYRDGASWLNAVALQRVDAPYTLRRPNPKVAVLVDNGVASSGEAAFIAFRKRANTRSFGAATCGLSTANSSFQLSDGAVLNLTTSVMADRDKTKYGDQVQPDEAIEGQAAVAERAVAWLQTANP